MLYDVKLSLRLKYRGKFMQGVITMTMKDKEAKIKAILSNWNENPFALFMGLDGTASIVPFVGPNGISHHYVGRFLHLIRCSDRQRRGRLGKSFNVILICMLVLLKLHAWQASPLYPMRTCRGPACLCSWSLGLVLYRSALVTVPIYPLNCAL